MPANPTIEVVMTEVVDAITAACRPMEIESDAVARFLEMYQPKFHNRLNNGSWHADRNNVLLAARQHGIIANAIATLGHRARVDSAIFLEAGGLVQKHCNDVFGEGVWCS